MKDLFSIQNETSIALRRFLSIIRGWNGHFQSGLRFGRGYPTREEIIRDEIHSLWLVAVENDFRRILRVIDEGVEIDPPIIISSQSSRLVCPLCGEQLALGFDGLGFQLISKGACPNPLGLVAEWELNVPSGEIVVADDLRSWFQVQYHYDINLPIGRFLATFDAIELGVAHGYVGNSNPKVYKEGDRYVIGSYSNNIWNGKKYVPNPEPCPWGEKVTSTLLWWFSIADADEWRRRVQNLDKDLKRVSIVPVRPGVYRFRQDLLVEGKDLVEWASFEWVREPDPVRNFLSEEQLPVVPVEEWSWS